MDVVSIARVAHQINKAFCEAQGDMSQPDWENAPDWQRISAVDGVCFHLANPDSTPAQSHANWLEEKKRTGWTWGPVKDVEKKEHPCFIEYERLPFEQRAKDYLFKAVVESLSNELE